MLARMSVFCILKAPRETLHHITQMQNKFLPNMETSALSHVNNGRFPLPFNSSATGTGYGAFSSAFSLG